jgi:manganese/iron transport system permease protein/iron/zinc/copper transport system permease protein
LFFRHFQISAFDPVMAASIGLPIVFLDYLLTTCVSLVVVSAVSMVGVILVVGLLITPAATAYLLSDRLSRMMALAALFGVTSVVGGLYLCVWLDTAGGGAIMVFSTLQFIVVLTLAPRYGLIARWLRQRHAVPQHVLEDILGALIRRAGDPATAGDIRPYVADGKRLRASLGNMVRDALITETNAHYTLTPKGAQEASRILRAHRLWESYLEHIGTPAGEVHERAHILEHIQDQRAIDYLDSLLGHPTTDPHGKSIPPKPA